MKDSISGPLMRCDGTDSRSLVQLDYSKSTNVLTIPIPPNASTSSLIFSPIKFPIAEWVSVSVATKSK